MKMVDVSAVHVPLLELRDVKVGMLANTNQCFLLRIS